jgi:hypothetical protein
VSFGGQKKCRTKFAATGSGNWFWAETSENCWTKFHSAKCLQQRSSFESGCHLLKTSSPHQTPFKSASHLQVSFIIFLKLCAPVQSDVKALQSTFSESLLFCWATWHCHKFRPQRQTQSSNAILGLKSKSHYGLFVRAQIVDRLQTREMLGRQPISRCSIELFGVQLFHSQ